ncbi:MAG: hypothetical protein RLZZ63_147 [Gemmatimonadota bacterium]|jgi:O-antigen ligase
MRDLALVLWVALLGADRIDLLGGAGPIVLTPFLLLTPIVVWSEALRRRQLGGGMLPLQPPRGAPFAATMLALLAVAGLSVLASRDISTSVGRLVLLTAISCGTGTVLWSLWDDPQWGDRVARGARWGLVLSASWSLLQVAQFLGWAPAEWGLGSVRVRLDPYTYAGILPRISGLTLDPNRAGLVTLLHWVLVDRARPHRSRWGLLAALLLAGTLSRSALLATAGYLVVRRFGRMSRTGRRHAISLGLSLPVGVAALVLVLAPTPRERLGRFLAPVAQRLSAAEGSTQTHTALMREGVAEATRDVPRTLMGVGYGTSYLLLRDRFGGDRYGNFHSLYVSIWVESGIVALALLLVLLLRPLLDPVEWRPVLFGAILFNVFYQSLTEPAFWAILILAWSAPIGRPVTRC